MEILIASAVAVIVLVAMGIMDASRNRMVADVHDRYNLLQGNQSNAALATLKIAKAIETADRLRILNAGVPATPGNVLQARFVNCPGGDPACFATAANYTWEEYRLSGNALQWLVHLSGGGCAVKTLAQQIQASSLNFEFRKEDPQLLPVANPGYNAVTYTFTWNNGTNIHAFSGEAIARAVVESLTVMVESGSGVDITNVSPPPAPCA